MEDSPAGGCPFKKFLSLHTATLSWLYMFKTWSGSSHFLSFYFLINKIRAPFPALVVWLSECENQRSIYESPLGIKSYECKGMSLDLFPSPKTSSSPVCHESLTLDCPSYSALCHKLHVLLKQIICTPLKNTLETNLNSLPVCCLSSPSNFSFFFLFLISYWSIAD